MVDPRGASLAAMRAAFCEHYRREVSFAADRALLGVLEREVEPVLAALLESGPADRCAALSATTADSPTARELSADLHDVYALLNLLAREAAEQGGTPGAALALVTALHAACAASGIALPAAAIRSMRVVAVEGYCAAREERAVRDLRRDASSAQGVCELARGAFLFSPRGRHAASDLAAAVDEIARELLRQGARSVVIDIARLALEEEEQARAVAELCADTRLLGVATIVVGADEPLRERFAGWSIGASSVQFVDDFPRAVALALGLAGHALRPLGRWRSMLRLPSTRER